MDDMKKLYTMYKQEIGADYKEALETWHECTVVEQLQTLDERERKFKKVTDKIKAIVRATGLRAIQMIPYAD